MYNYITDINRTEKIYYCKPSVGLCERTKGCERVVIKNATDKFYVYADKDAVKTVALNKNSELIYSICRNNCREEYVISKLNEDICIKKIMVGNNGKNENLFYSAKIHGETVLVHCVLGNNAMPAVVAKLFDEDFFLFEKSVWYSGENRIIGCQSYADSKPDRFVPCCEGTSPYLIDNNGKKLVYLNNNSVFVNEKKYCTDKKAQKPILNTDDENLLMWRSGDYVRSIRIDEKNSRVSRYISDGTKPQIFVKAYPDKCYYRYGINSDGKYKLY